MRMKQQKGGRRRDGSATRKQVLDLKNTFAGERGKRLQRRKELCTRMNLAGTARLCRGVSNRSLLRRGGGEMGGRFGIRKDEKCLKKEGKKEGFRKRSLDTKKPDQRVRCLTCQEEEMDDRGGEEFQLSRRGRLNRVRKGRRRRKPNLPRKTPTMGGGRTTNNVGVKEQRR